MKKAKIIIPLSILAILISIFSFIYLQSQQEIEYPPLDPEKGRIIFDSNVYETIITRKIIDDFLIGVGTTDYKDGCVSSAILKDLRKNGINYFLPFPSWASIEKSPGVYTGTPCPGKNSIFWLNKSGAVLNGHCFIFLINEEYTIPSFAFGHSFMEQKMMIKNFIKETVLLYPQLEIWTLNEPIVQNCFNWTEEQIYDIFVSASKWIHETNPQAKVMINMIPINNSWSGIDYTPNKVMDALIYRGLEADIIGIELYNWFAGYEVDENGYASLEWIENTVNIFKPYNLPIIISEIGAPGIIESNIQFDKQADWMESIFRFFHNDEKVIGAVWYFIRDDIFLPTAGLMDNNYNCRDIGERLKELANEWNPASTHYLNGSNFLDMDPGTYDIIMNEEVIQLNINEGQIISLMNNPSISGASMLFFIISFLFGISYYAIFSN